MTKVKFVPCGQLKCPNVPGLFIISLSFGRT